MKDEKSISIVVATHKSYRMPDDSMYIPLHVGAEGKEDSYGNPLDLGYEKDNTGDNISKKNATFCELTGLYWAWKNLDTDYIGIVHYRRHFLGKTRSGDLFDCILKKKEIKPYLGKKRVFVPTKRRYFIETLYSHYAHTHYAEQLDKTRVIIQNMYPEYVRSYDRVIRKSSGYMFNMMILEKSLLNEYCSWLFSILFKLEEEIKLDDLSFFQRRLFGRVSEIVFNAWLDYQITTGKIKKDEVLVLKCIHMEKINWWKKGTAFLKAKFFKKRYEDSF